MGAETGAAVACGTCKGSVRNKEFRCAVHGTCVPAVTCPACPDYARREFPAVAAKHLLYHVYPRRNSRWRVRLLRLRERLGLFDGVKVVAVATDGTTDTLHHVERELDGTGCELLHFPNDPDLREVATFRPLFDRLRAVAAPADAVLYGHAKGVTRPEGATCHRWCAVLEELMIERFDAVAAVLRHHPVAGCFKKVGRGWAAHESQSPWHYSGSWCWYRCGELFARDWTRIDRFWSGIESYPSLHFAPDEAGVVFHEGPVPRVNLYDGAFWRDAIEPALARWHAARAAGPEPEPLRVELGGGRLPRPGFVNVDREPGADVVLDLERDPLPFADASVGELYSSHCLEHVVNLRHVLREIVRVCRVGARVEVRVPHWLSEMALCHDHKQTIGDEQVRHWCETAVDYWFGGAPRRLAFVRVERAPSAYHAEARTLFPHLTEEQLSRFVPDCFHENRYHMTVTDR